MALWAVTLTLTVIAAWLGVTLVPTDVPYHTAIGLPEATTFTAVIITYGTVGALIVARRPGNAVGWLFLGISIVDALSVIGEAYALYGTYVVPGAVPASALVYRIEQSLST